MTNTIWEKLFYTVVVLAVIGWGLLLGKDLSWDVLNHHVYLPFSWLTGRIDQDLFAAGPQSYQNPLGYFLFYGLLSLNLPSLSIGLILSLLHSLNGIFTILLVDELWETELRKRFSWIVIAALLGITAPIFLQSVGTSSVDPISSALVIAALWLALKLYRTYHGYIAPVLAGICLGLAFSIKQSNAVFVIAVGLVVLMAWAAGKIRVKQIVCFTLGGVVSILAGMGWYSLYLFDRFQNPVFPLFNNIFKSAYYPEESVLAGRFVAQDLGDYFYRLLDVAEMKRLVYFEGFMPDIRPIILAGLIAVFVVMIGCKSVVNKSIKNSMALRLADFAVLLWIIVSYTLWMMTSGNGRYAIPLFIVVGVMVVRMSYLVMPSKISKIFVMVILLLQLGYTTSAADLRFIVEPWDNAKYFKLEIPSRLSEEPFLHISVGTLSYSFLAKYFHPEGAQINLVGQYTLPVDGPLGKEVEILLNSWSGRIRLLGNAVDVADEDLLRSSEVAVSYMLFRYGLTADFSDCEPISMERNDLSANGLTQWVHRHNQFVNADGEFQLFSCALIPNHAKPEYSAGEIKADLVFDVIQQECPQLYGPRSWVSERTPDFWWRFFANTDTIVKVYEDQVIAQQPRSPIDRVLGSPADVINGKGTLDCSPWNMITPD